MGTAAVVLPWPDHLDALEEWLRRTAATLASPEGGVVGPLTTAPDGPLPADLRVRAASALQSLDRLRQAGEQRRRELVRGQAYSRY